jgi:hypothetical protein
MPHKRPYYKKCKDCGANLDPGERCDCGGKPADVSRPEEGKPCADLIAAYIRHMRMGNRSELTYDHYASLLKRFNQFLLEQHVGDLISGDASGITRRSLEGLY